MRAITAPNYGLLGVMGDVHSHAPWTLQAIERFAALGVTHILQVGDFGIWPTVTGENFLRDVNRKLLELGVLMVVVPGNHENYTRLENELRPAAHYSSFLQLPEYDGILFAARGQRWNWDNTDFCALGGANSINKDSLVPFVSWWPQESISLGDVYRTVDGGRADIMLTHEVPDGVPIVQDLSHHSKDRGWSPEALGYAHDSRAMLRQAVDAVQPELLIHGHYHVFVDLDVEFGVLGTDESYSMRSVCLDMEETPGNMALLQPRTRTLTKYDDWIAQTAE